MLRLTVILALGLQTIGVGQDFTGQVFMLTEYFVDDKCEVFAECDCCSTDLFFLKDKEFGMVSRCLYNDSYFRGTYGLKWRASLKEDIGDYTGASMDINEAMKRRPKDKTLIKLRDRLTYFIIEDKKQTASG